MQEERLDPRTKIVRTPGRVEFRIRPVGVLARLDFATSVPLGLTLGGSLLLWSLLTAFDLTEPSLGSTVVYGVAVFIGLGMIGLALFLWWNVFSIEYLVVGNTEIWIGRKIGGKGRGHAHPIDQFDFCEPDETWVTVHFKSKKSRNFGGGLDKTTLHTLATKINQSIKTSNAIDNR